MHSIYIFLKNNSATKRVFSDLKLSFPESRRNFTLVAQNIVFGENLLAHEKQTFQKKVFLLYIFGGSRRTGKRNAEIAFRMASRRIRQLSQSTATPIACNNKKQNGIGLGATLEPFPRECSHEKKTVWNRTPETKHGKKGWKKPVGINKQTHTNEPESNKQTNEPTNKQTVLVVSNRVPQIWFGFSILSDSSQIIPWTPK